MPAQFWGCFGFFVPQQNACVHLNVQEPEENLNKRRTWHHKDILIHRLDSQKAL